MFLRWLLGILIIGVAAAMTTALVRMVYFPEESRLAREEPQLVLERFLSRTAAESVLDIWKGNEIVGSLRVSPLGLPPIEKLRLQATARLRSEADLQISLPGLEGTKVRLVSNMAMALDGSVKESDLKLSTNGFGPTLSIRQPLDAKEPRLILEQAGEILMDTGNQIAGDPQSEIMLGLFMRTIGIDVQELKKRQAQAEKTAAATTTEARRGGFTVKGQTFMGYVLTTTLGGPDRKFTLYISESGELVQMKTSFLDYQFISEGLRPAGVLGPIPSNQRSRFPSAPPPP